MREPRGVLIKGARAVRGEPAVKIRPVSTDLKQPCYRRNVFFKKMLSAIFLNG